MKKMILGLGLLFLFFPLFPVHASDLSGDVVNTDEGTFIESLDTKSPFSRHQVEVTGGEVTLAQDDSGNYVTSGSIQRNNSVLKKSYYYFESAELDLDAHLPDGTSIDLYLRTVDPDGTPGVHTRPRKWTKVESGEKIDLGSFQEFYAGEGYYPTSERNNLRWKAVLHTDDLSVSPALYSVTVTFYGARPKVEQLELLQNVVGVNRTEGATATVTLYGGGFQEDKEEVFLKNLYSATSVQFVNSKTLVVVIPIEDLSAGTYTVIVRNTQTGRMYKTDSDGYPVEEPFDQPDPANLRLVLKWFAPEIDSFTPTHVSYSDGDTVTITGAYFSYGSKVMIAPEDEIDADLEDEIFLPSDSVTLVDEHTIQIDVTSGIITSYGLDRDTNLNILVRTPDYQTVSADGFYID